MPNKQFAVVGAIAAIAATLAFAPLSAQAQFRASTNNAADSGGRSWIPYTSQGYIGGNLGQSNWDARCQGANTCNEDYLGFKVYTGGNLWRLVGLELGYINMGKAESSGGAIKAQGVNLSLVGNIPLQWFNVFGKVGTTYGWTKTTGTVPGYQTGNENGFGLSYGAGIGFDVHRNVQIVAEWERHRFEFARGDDEVSLWSLGVKYKF